MQQTLRTANCYVEMSESEFRFNFQERTAVTIARAMKQHGDDLDYIALITGLTKDELENL